MLQSLLTEFNNSTSNRRGSPSRLQTLISYGIPDKEPRKLCFQPTQIQHRTCESILSVIEESVMRKRVLYSIEHLPKSFNSVRTSDLTYEHINSKFDIDDIQSMIKQQA